MTDTPALEAPLVEDLLASLNRSVIEDPAVLAVEIATGTREVEDAAVTFQTDFDRVDRAGDPNAYLWLQPTAERLQARREHLETLPPRKTKAERQQAAFLQVAAYCRAIGERKEGLTTAMLAPPLDEKERARLLDELLETARLHDRLVWLCGRYSRHRLFREGPNPLVKLRAEWEARVRELTRANLPGNRPSKYVWPSEIADAIDALEGRATQQEEVHVR